MNNNYYPKALLALMAILLLGTSTLSAQYNADSAYTAQMEKVRKLNWKKQLEVGKVLYNKGSYYNAIDVLKMSYDAKPEKNHCGAYLLAASYYQARDYANAETYFRKVLELDSTKHPYTYYYLGQSLKRQGKYGEAKTAFNMFKTTEPDKISTDFAALQKTVDMEVAGCELGMQMMSGGPVKAEVRHLDRGANHPLTDFSPFELADGRLLYGALANDTLIDITDSSIMGQNRYTRLYVTSQGNETWAAGQLFNVPFNKGDYHIGNGIYSPDSSRFYFTRCTETEVITKMHCEIWVSTRSGSIWGEPTKLGNGINGDNHTTTHPYSVLDETGREVLYFSSDRQGGSGGMDIWYTYPDLKGNYSTPVNAGANINTAQDEITPAYSTSKNTLYFSSLGRINIGGFDVYASVKDSTSGFALPEHLGFPINSSVDDMYFRPSNSTRGFLVSNRAGGYNLKSPNCCDDILGYSFPPTNIFVEGDVVDNATGLPITDAIVYIYKTDNDSLVASAQLDSLGKYRFQLDGGPDYMIVAGDDTKYAEQRKEFSTSELEDNAVVRQDFKLDKNDYWPGMVVGKIYFKFDRYDLMKGGTATLDSVVAFLKAHPKVQIEVAGHADEIGDSTYNQDLSMRRAETAFSYLTIVGKVEDKRLIKKWYGEDRPAVPNTNPDGSDNPTNRQLNRRTEFVIIGDVEETAMP